MARDYARQLRQLMPSGPLWDDLGQTLRDILDGLAVEFSRTDARGVDLEVELDPRTSTELLEEWETALGLPDADCDAPVAVTLADRRKAVDARLTSRGKAAGGTGVLFLRRLATALGYTGTDFVIRRFHRQPFTSGSRCIDSLNSRDTGWLFLYEFIVTHAALDAQLECELDRRAAGHLITTYAFPLVQYTDLTFTRSSTGTYTHPTSGEQTALAEDEVGQAYIGV